MHPAVVKAQEFGRIAKEYGWTGKIDSEIQETPVFERQRVTILRATRNDETIVIAWHGKAFKHGYYGMFGETISAIHSIGEARKKVRGWPNIMDLFKKVAPERRPALSAVYVKLPFTADSSDSEIISSLVNRKLYWYNRIDGGIYDDVLMKSTKNRIQDIGHRKLLHFIGAATGFRSVFIDQILKVG
jgi:hypothetical protein